MVSSSWNWLWRALGDPAKLLQRRLLRQPHAAIRMTRAWHGSDYSNSTQNQEVGNEWEGSRKHEKEVVSSRVVVRFNALYVSFCVFVISVADSQLVPPRLTGTPESEPAVAIEPGCTRDGKARPPRRPAPRWQRGATSENRRIEASSSRTPRKPRNRQQPRQPPFP